MTIRNIGVLILGAPGCGKSRLAHALIEDGNQLIADDLVDIAKQADGDLVGQAPAKLAGLLHLRHLGLFDIRSLYGAQAYRASARIDFAVTLDPALELPPAILELPLETLELCQRHIPAISINLSAEKSPAAILKLLIRQLFPQLMVPKSAKRNIITAINS